MQCDGHLQATQCACTHDPMSVNLHHIEALTVWSGLKAQEGYACMLSEILTRGYSRGRRCSKVPTHHLHTWSWLQRRDDKTEAVKCAHLHSWVRGVCSGARGP